MEDILDLYQQPYDPARPVINMDEKPIQLIEETRLPIPAKPGCSGQAQTDTFFKPPDQILRIHWGSGSPDTNAYGSSYRTFRYTQ